jgi:exonuclease SbcC
MKILQLRFKNLNSLAGEWTIDFTAPEYLSDGIFAISGPTGAGKSTIMDAICLALYGRTPRLKGISKNSNEIMSRHTGECFAEVVFETQKGQFRCTWRQHRARRKPNEELQNPSHEIADLQSGNIIESKIRSVAIAIEERTGMDFDRFTQSMLLAQGGFAAFLQADPNERAPILEQITGTGIYSKISIDVYERRRAENGELDLLKAKTDGFATLNPQEESILIQQLADLQKVESELTKKKTEIDQSILWLNGINKIKDELTEIVKEAEVHSLALQDFEPVRQILDKAVKAASLDGEYATITAKRKLQADELAVLSNSEQKIPELLSGLELAKKQHVEVSNTLGLERKQADAELGKIKWVRALDISIKEKQTVLSKAILEHKGFLSEKISNIRKKIALQDELLLAKGALSKVENYLITNKTDAVLVTELTGIKERLKNFQEAKAVNLNLKTQLVASEKLRDHAEEHYKIQWETFQNLEKKHLIAHGKVTRSQLALQNLLGERQLREYRSDLAHLNKEMIYLRKIFDLESERKLLADNQPCPLCGALRHPFAEGNIPDPDETQRKVNELTALIDQADQLEAGQKVLEGDERRVASELNAADKQLQQTSSKWIRCATPTVHARA